MIFELIDKKGILRMQDHFWRMNLRCVIIDCFVQNGMGLLRHQEGLVNASDDTEYTGNLVY